MNMCNRGITICVVVMMLLFSGTEAQAQLFSKSAISFPNTLRSSVNWVDLNKDGYLDLAISGEDWDGSGFAQGKIYLFGSDHLISSNKNIRPLSEGSQTWSDFNNDGSPDMLYAGTNTVATAGLDTFDVSLNYHSKYSGFTPLTKATTDWGDYDNDGDYDVLMAGKDATGVPVTRLYRNSRGSFTDVNAGLPGISDGKVAFIDYDLDQDLDIFISGLDINVNKYTRLWKNDGGTYTITNDQFVNLRYSQFDWGDINGDGYPDLMLGGWDDSKCRGLIYINNGGNGFTLSSYKVPQANRGTSAFGDVDNDGDFDVFISGVKFQTSILYNLIFYNNAVDSLVPDNFSLPDRLVYSSAQFADYDNDNVLDFAANGMKEDGNGMTFIGINSFATPNPKPSVPLNLSVVVDGTSVILSWDNSTDNNTPQQSMTYNIYVGTATNKSSIVSPMADLTNGFRRIARAGYIRDNKWIIKNLPVGTYYWGVQAIDNSLGASSFSAESSFVISERFTKVSSTETPSLSSPAIYFDCDHDNDLDIVLNNINAFQIIENKLAPFSQADYRTISANGYNPIYTITPNDYDNDNRIDFSVSGNYTINDVRDSSVALFSYSAPFSYNIVNQALTKNVVFEYVLWTDLDNDGRQDFVTSGRTTNLTVNKPVTRIYRNLGDGIFQKVPHQVRGFEKCGAVAGDFDNDMDVDLFIYGKDSLGAANSYVYVNEGDFVFTEKLVPLNELYRKYLQSYIFTGDFNLDGQLDIYMSGNTLLDDKYVRVLLNNQMNFTDANLQIRSATTMSNFWADYDYDGDLDLYSLSVLGSSDKTRLYLNNNGTLEELIIDLGATNKLELPFMAVNLDKRNGLDFLMKISNGNYNQYYDNWGSDGRISTAPSNIQFDQDKLDIILSWDKLPDCPACTYNVRVGTTPGGSEIMSPMSDITTGYRYVVGPGNTWANDRWKLSGMDVGTYYWSVQAVDPSNTGGPWAAEETFNVSHIDADFSFTTVCLGDSTSFSDLSVATATINKWKWNFGDGMTSNLQNPRHRYASSGMFTAGLWVYSTAGDSAFQSYTVPVKAVPVAGFTSNIACQGTPTTFVNTTDTAGLTITNWLWIFGDGQTSNLRNPGTHGYLNPGDYTASLTVVAGNSCSDVVTATVTVGSYPVASVTADAPLTFCKGDSVRLTVPYNSFYTYNWMTGGISLTEGDSSGYTARISGSYSVEVVNPKGNCKTTSSSLTVSALDAPVAPLIAAEGDIIFCEGDSVTLSVTNTPGYIYQWKNNGGAVGGNSYKYIAKTSGTYSLTVSNSSECRTEAVNPVTVTVQTKPVMPAVSINGSTTFCEGSGAELSVTINPVLDYQWENNGTAITGAASNNYFVQTAGMYSLRITDLNGCSNRSEDIPVYVVTPPSPPLIISSGALEFCQGDSVILSVTNTLNYSYQWKLEGTPVGNDSSLIIAKVPGRYSLTVSRTINLTTCSANSVNTLDVVVNPSPAIPTVSLSGAASFCQGGSVTIEVPSSTGNTYNWRNESGLITGAVSSSYTALTTGKYQLEITDLNGCSSRTSPVDVSVKPSPARPSLISENYVEGKCSGKQPIKLSVSSPGTENRYMWIKNGELQYSDTLTFIQFYDKGTYKVRADLGGCTSESEAMVITLPDAPDKPIVYVRGPVVWYMAASSNTADRYQWYRNGELLQGATRFIYVANKTLGTYKVAVGNKNECYTMSDDVTIPLTKGEMSDFYIPPQYLISDDNDIFANMQIYPNPTTGMFSIEMENQAEGQIFIRVVTEQGKEILNIKTGKSSEYFKQEIDLGSQAKGVYFIDLKLNDYSATRKIILE